MPTPANPTALAQQARRSYVERLIGGMLMTHSDDDGFVCPPKLAPTHVVILPVTHKAESSGN